MFFQTKKVVHMILIMTFFAVFKSFLLISIVIQIYDKQNYAKIEI